MGLNMADKTLVEIETHLNMSAVDRDAWEMATDDDVMKRRMERMGIAPTRKQGDVCFYQLTSANIVIRKGKRAMSEAQRLQAAERMRNMHRQGKT